MASASADSKFFVSILKCADGSLYVGHSADVAARLRAHEAGEWAAWAACRRPVELVYVEEVGAQHAAVRREQRLKRLTHEKKLALIRGDLARLKSPAKRRA